MVTHTGQDTREGEGLKKRFMCADPFDFSHATVLVSCLMVLLLRFVLESEILYLSQEETAYIAG